MQQRVVDKLDRDRDPRSDGLSLAQFEKFTQQIRDQPDWRVEADRCADYYDNNQLDRETLARLEARGMGPLIRNLVKPTIDLVLGIEAQNKRDWRVEADTDEVEETAEGLSSKLHESEREARADRAISDAFGASVKAGLGWVEVGESPDPFDYPDTVEYIHRREMWWDWFARKPDLKDAGWLIRRRWYEVDYLKGLLPQWAWVFDTAFDNWGRAWIDSGDRQPWLGEGPEQPARSSLTEMEWIDRTRRRVCLHEVRHRVYVRGYVLTLPDGRVVELDLDNPMHLLAVNQGVRPEARLYSKWQVSLWAGPYRLSASDKVPNGLPWIPFWAFREDLTGIPYGMIRTMVSQQDEVNARRQMLMWMLSSVVVQMDADALDQKNNTIGDVMERVARPDFAVILDPNRTNKAGGFNISRNAQLANQQFEVMKDAEQGLQAVAGVFGQMLGDAGSVTAGTAINQLINQGTTGLAELFDNLGYARRLVGERLLSQIRQRIKGVEVDVVVGERGKPRSIITLNRPAVDPRTGLVYLENDTERCKLKVALEDVPSTPTYRTQQQTMMAEMIKGLPPQLQAVAAPYWVELGDSPRKHELAGAMRKVLGLGGDGSGDDPETVALRQRVEQLTAALEQLKQAPVIAKTQAEAERARADAEHRRAQTDRLHLETIDQIHRPGADAAVPARH
ncbi:hypothetical protein [Methylomagnum ishizawai]|uniref:portal protein n=1 Tax=Methylomagnum ishizawai TaxID=1760988 RepID=UPI001C827AAE|nr:hypothetical protein [Methylomagnum ishizawai]